MARIRTTANRRTAVSAAGEHQTLIRAALVFFGGALALSLWLVFSPATPSSGPNTVLGGLSIGPEHGCVIRKEYSVDAEEETQSIIDSGVWCWGRNDNGELGNGLGGPTAYDPNTRSEVKTAGAVRVSEIQNARSVTVVGTDRTCAVTESDELWCWGVRRPIGMTRNFWSDSSFANAKETGRANRLTPERVMRGVKGFYAYSIDRPAYGVDDLDRYACAIMAGGNGDGISCWGANQGEIGADGARGLGMSPAAIAGLPTMAEILSLELRADRACATVSRRGVEGVEHWCWEHRVASAEPVDESAPYVVERMEVGQAYQSDLHKKYGLTLRDGFLSGDGEPYCQIATPFRDGTGGGPVSMNCRGYDDLPFYISGYWLDTGESLGIASSSPETRWFGNVLNNGEGGTIEGRPAGVKLWLGQIEATASYICAAYQLSPNVAPNGDPNHQGVYCYTRQPAPGGWPQVAWAQRAIEIPRITRASNSESLNASTAPSIGELAVVANRLPSGREDGNGCALLNADLLLCWGHNDLGQLGSGDTEDRPNGYFVRFNLETE